MERIGFLKGPAKGSKQWTAQFVNICWTIQVGTQRDISKKVSNFVEMYRRLMK